jgi:transposase
MEESGRYVGLDLGKRTYTMAVVGKRGGTTMSNGTTTAAGRQALYRKLNRTDKVALEAGSLAFLMAKELEAAAGCRVYVLNPHHLAVICRPMKTTGKEDALKPARLLEDTREERPPVVPVPSGREMQRRKLAAAYRREQGNRNRAVNRPHALFVSRGITAAVKKDPAKAAGRAEQAQALDGLEREEADYLADCLGLYEKRLAALEGQMKEEAAGDGEIERLQTVPGAGPKAAFTFAAHAAAERFENGGQVSNYPGLVPICPGTR